MTEIFFILLAAGLVISNFLLFQVIGGKLLGAEIEEIGLLIGPEIFKFRVGGLTFSVNFIPLGGYVKFAESFENLAPFKKLLIVLAGLLSYLVLALVCLGLNETIRQTTSFYWQTIQGAWSPLQIGSIYIEKLAGILSEQSFWIGVGIFAAKMLGGNLLPLGMLAGGNIVLRVLELFGFKSEKFSERFNLITFLVWLPIALSWIGAIIYFVIRALGK